jgi:hypothetical protein
MAVSILQALFLVESWRGGAHFVPTLTLGRIGHLMPRHDLKRLARLLPKKSEFVHMVERGELPQYSDELFKAIGTRVDAMEMRATLRAPHWRNLQCCNMPARPTKGW